jgi:hypothetical protein
VGGGGGGQESEEEVPAALGPLRRHEAADWRRKEEEAARRAGREGGDGEVRRSELVGTVEMVGKGFCAIKSKCRGVFGYFSAFASSSSSLSKKKERGGTRQGIKSLYRKVVLLRRFKFRIDLKNGPARHFVSRSQVFVCSYHSLVMPRLFFFLCVCVGLRMNILLSRRNDVSGILTRRPKIRNLRRRLRSRTFQAHMVPSLQAANANLS